MKVEDRTYYEEEQKMEANWILFIVVAMSLSILGIAIGVMIHDKEEWASIAIVAGAIIFSDLLIVVLFKRMKLELALTKKGLHYNMTTMAGKNKFLSWEEVSSITIRKSPASGFGKKNKFRYGEVYAMNFKKGVELSLKNGKKKFYSLRDSDEFLRSFRKLELAIEIK